ARRDAQRGARSRAAALGRSCRARGAARAARAGAGRTRVATARAAQRARARPLRGPLAQRDRGAPPRPARHRQDARPARPCEARDAARRAPSRRRPVTCAEFKEAVAAYALGIVDPDERAAMARHLADGVAHDGCLEALAEAYETSALLGAALP